MKDKIFPLVLEKKIALSPFIYLQTFVVVRKFHSKVSLTNFMKKENPDRSIEFKAFFLEWNKGGFWILVTLLHLLV